MKQHHNNQPNRVVECNCCFALISHKKSIQLVDECCHVYCKKCLRTTFRMVIANEADFPPSCCSKTIDVRSVKHLLYRPQTKAYEKAGLEYTTPRADRRYCADSHCNSFLGRANNNLLRCDKCGNLTCNSCKDYAHPGPCKVERGRDVGKLDKDLENLATAEGWQHCSSCSRLVILVDGCNRITCRCRHEFCYICGAKWKTCTCPQWQRPDLQQQPLWVDDPELFFNYHDHIYYRWPRLILYPLADLER